MRWPRAHDARRPDAQAEGADGQRHVCKQMLPNVRRSRGTDWVRDGWVRDRTRRHRGSNTARSLDRQGGVQPFRGRQDMDDEECCRGERRVVLL